MPETGAGRLRGRAHGGVGDNRARPRPARGFHYRAFQQAEHPTATARTRPADASSSAKSAEPNTDNTAAKAPNTAPEHEPNVNTANDNVSLTKNNKTTTAPEATDPASGRTPAGPAGQTNTVIETGAGDAAELLEAVRRVRRDGAPLFPLLRGPKISPVWVLSTHQQETEHQGGLGLGPERRLLGVCVRGLEFEVQG